MNVFVTGGTGFVGSHLVEALLTEGHEVICLVRNPAKARRVFGERMPTVVEGDLARDATIPRAIANADLVFHLAGLTAARSRGELFAVNEAATRSMVSAAAGARSLTRFIHVGSLASAGPSAAGRQHLGGEPDRPVTPYGESKLAGETAVRESGLPWTIVRPPVVYGPRDVELFKLFRLARFGVMPVFGDGMQELSLVYVADLVRALLVLANTPGAVGETYYPTHPDVIRQRALAAAVHRAVRAKSGGGPLIVPVPEPIARGVLWISGTAARLGGGATVLSPAKAPEFFAPALTCSPARLERDTGWTAAYDLATGLTETAEWYRRHGWL